MFSKISYPELALIEEDMSRYYTALSKKSLAKRMAYSAGFESMTLGATRFIIDERCTIFRNADTRVASFWLWHMTEETEHKTCAYDAYQAACGGYFTRLVGVYHGSIGGFWPGMRAAVLMLKKDGLWKSWRSRLRFFKQVAKFMRYVAPFLLRSSLPSHNPRSEKDLEWVKEWLSRYPVEGVLAEPPLVDTSHPNIPVPKMTFMKTEVIHGTA
jgi:predicted metal-dependent hydrolase